MVMKGSHLTAETKLKISLAHKGKKLSESHKKAISIGGMGRRHTKKSIEKMRIAVKKQYEKGRKPIWQDKKMPKWMVQKRVDTIKFRCYGNKKRIGPYIYVLQHDHPLANKRGYIMEHRLVMERMIGRYLKREEVVHHKNHIKDDNRPCNLELIKNHSKHMSSEHRNINLGRTK